MVNNLWFLFGNLLVCFVIYWAWKQDVAKGQELEQQQLGEGRQTDKKG